MLRGQGVDGKLFGLHSGSLLFRGAGQVGAHPGPGRSVLREVRSITARTNPGSPAESTLAIQ
jgi:hypothetical protein